MQWVRGVFQTPQFSQSRQDIPHRVLVGEASRAESANSLSRRAILESVRIPEGITAKAIARKLEKHRRLN